MALSSEGRTPYLQHLVERRGQIRPTLDAVLREYQGLFVGDYNEIIVRRERVVELIEALARLPVTMMAMD